MLWTQSAVCFVLWIAYGIWLRGRTTEIARTLKAIPQRKLVFRSGLMMVGGALLLLAGLVGVSLGNGFTRDGLTGWGWAVVALMGLGFVHLQVHGAMAMVLALQIAPKSKSDEKDTDSETSKP